MVGKRPLNSHFLFPERRPGCERISPDPLGHGTTRQTGRNLTLMYPTLGLGSGHVPQRADRDLAGFEPRILRFQGFPEGRSGCEDLTYLMKCVMP